MRLSCKALMSGLILLTLAIALCVHADELPHATAGPDVRYPVQVTPNEAVRQKDEMRGNLVALRHTLRALANKDFAAAEVSLGKLAHEGIEAKRPGVSTAIFRELERGFETSVDETIRAVRTQKVDVVLRSLSETMGFCQACHMAFRQAVADKAAAARTK